MPDQPLTPIIKLNGAAQPEALASRLRRLAVELSVHRSGRAHLTYDDPGYELLDGDVVSIGDDVTVQLHTADEVLEAVFIGTVSAVGLEQDAEHGTPQLVIEARDAREKFDRASQPQTFVEMTRGDAIGRIAQSHGLDADVEVPGPKEPWLLQTGTDRAFLDRCCAELGCEWFVDDTTLYVRHRRTDAAAVLSFEEGTLRNFSASYSAEGMPKSIKARGWDPAAQQAIVATSDEASKPKEAALGGGAPFISESHKQAVKGFGRALEIAVDPVRNEKEGELRADGVARRLLASALRVEGLAEGDAAIRPGGTVEVTDVGKRLSGTYYVTDVVHEFGPGETVVTRFMTGEPTRDTGDHAGGLDGWGTQGLVTGRVTNLEDPDNVGRVKVRWPVLGESIESDWARVLHAGAGKQRGLDVHPEVNDEVLIAFEQGDPRFPVVLGGLHSKKNPPEEPAFHKNGKVITRALTTRVGHRIALVDGDGPDQRLVEITLADGKTRLQVREDGVLVEAAQGQPLVLKSGKASVTLTDKGNVEVAGQDITLKATGNVAIEGQKVEVKAKMGAKLEGGNQAEVAGTKVSVAAQAQAEVKGAMVKIN